MEPQKRGKLDEIKKGLRKLCPCGISDKKGAKTCMKTCDYCAKYTNAKYTNIVFLEH